MNSRAFYSREDVQNELVRIAKDREIQIWYGREKMGRRPDTINFKGDLKDLIRRGMTSLHVSEERWQDPLLLKPGMNKKDLNEMRLGWDLVLDLDGKDFEFSKMAGILILDLLNFYDVKNVSTKFSVTGDTPVLIKFEGIKRLMPIKDAVGLYELRASMEVLSLDMNNRLVFSKVKGSLVHADEIYEIYYQQSGIPLKVTGNHSVFCWENGKIFEKEVRQLKEKDYLISFMSSKEIEAKIPKVVNEFTFLRKNKKIKINLTKDLMRLIGYYLAEGHATETNYMVGFSFNKNETGYIRNVKKLIKKVTGDSVNIRDGFPNPNSHQIIFHSKEWFSFFSGFCGVRAEKHIPDFIWDLPKEYFLQLLLTYVRGDGHKLSKYYLTVKSVSHRMATEFVWLCKLHNISCNLYEEYNKPHKLPQGNYFKGSHVYMIKIPRSDIPLKEFYISRNKFSPYPGSRVFPIGGLKEVYKKIKPGKFLSHRLEQVTLHKKRANLERIAKVVQWFEKYHTLPIDVESKKIIESYKKIIEGDICVLPVRKIIKKKGKEKVYDLSVENTERFFGNYYPILLHNSGNKGFHIGVPFESFPPEVNGIMIKDHFPEGLRIIAEFIAEKIKPFLTEKIFAWKDLDTLAKDYFEGDKSKMYKKEEFDPFTLIDIDSVLISSRHLFRAPYVFNEKSGLVSVIVHDIKNFEREHATADKVIVEGSFLERKGIIPGTASRLLMDAFDWGTKIRERKEFVEEEVKKIVKKEYEVPKVAIESSFFPPCINLLLAGQIKDGRKRGVFILINFLQNAGWGWEKIEEELFKWNEKFDEPLREGYIRSQLSWSKRIGKALLPPNCDNDVYYKSMAICCPDTFCKYVKNPVNYMMKRLNFAQNVKKKKVKKKVVKKKSNDNVKKVKTIIFDLGGVLVSDAPIYYKNNLCDFKEVLNYAGVSEEQAKQLWKQHWPNLKLGKSTILSFWKDFEKFTNKPVLEIIKKYEEKIILDQKIYDFIIDLKGKYRILALANESKEGMDLKIKKFRLNDLFEKIYCSGYLGFAKPFPKIYKYLIKDASLNLENTIFVDNQIENVKAAEKEGIKSILFENLDQLKKNLEIN